MSPFAILPDTVYIRKPEKLGLMYKELDFLCYTEMLEDYNAVINTVAQQPEV